MSWESLPYDISFQILETLCGDIISDFKDLCEYVCDWINTFSDAHGWVVDGVKIRSGEVKSYPSLEWPAPPTALNSFISAITTCREFNDIILHQIRFDGTHTSDVLKTQQARTIYDITRFPYKHSVSIDIAFFYQAAGAFWKNPIVINYFRYIPDVFVMSTRTSRKMLFPHLEPWLHRQCHEVQGIAETTVRLAYTKPLDHVVHQFHLKLNPKRARHVRIANVDFIVGWNSSPTLMEQDLLASPPGQWWLLTGFQSGWIERSRDWVLINYEEKRMYYGHDPTEAVVWKGRDSLRMATWVRWHSLEAIKHF